jgi:hypothetical protein
MSDTARLCELLQAHAQLLRVRIAAEGTKEYKADWLKNADTVVRDGSGKFAKKGTSSATPETPTPGQPPTVQEKVGQAVSDTKKVTSLLLEGGEVTVEMLKKLLTDKDFRRRAGLEAGQTGAQAIKRLAEAAKVNPEFTKKLDSYINKFNQDLIKEYGDDGGAMAQAIRKHGNLPPGDNLQQRLELQVAKYRAMEDVLESPEVYKKEDPKSFKSLSKKAIAVSLPIGVTLAIALAPEILLSAGAISLPQFLISFAAGELANLGVEKIMDKLDVQNPVARFSIGMGVGILTGGIISNAYATRKVPMERLKQIEKDLSDMVPDVNIFKKDIDKIKQMDSTNSLSRTDFMNQDKDISTPQIRQMFLNHYKREIESFTESVGAGHRHQKSGIKFAERRINEFWESISKIRTEQNYELYTKHYPNISEELKNELEEVVKKVSPNSKNITKRGVKLNLLTEEEVKAVKKHLAQYPYYKPFKKEYEEFFKKQKDFTERMKDFNKIHTLADLLSNQKIHSKLMVDQLDKIEDGIKKLDTAKNRYTNMAIEDVDISDVIDNFSDLNSKIKVYIDRDESSTYTGLAKQFQKNLSEIYALMDDPFLAPYLKVGRNYEDFQYGGEKINKAIADAGNFSKLGGAYNVGVGVSSLTDDYKKKNKES